MPTLQRFVDEMQRELSTYGLAHFQSKGSTDILTRAVRSFGERVMEATEAPVTNKKYKDLQRPTAEQCCEGVAQAIRDFGVELK